MSHVGIAASTHAFNGLVIVGLVIVGLALASFVLAPDYARLPHFSCKPKICIETHKDDLARALCETCSPLLANLNGVALDDDDDDAREVLINNKRNLYIQKHMKMLESLQTMTLEERKANYIFFHRESTIIMPKPGELETVLHCLAIGDVKRLQTDFAEWFPPNESFGGDPGGHIFCHRYENWSSMIFSYADRFEDGLLVPLQTVMKASPDCFHPKLRACMFGALAHMDQQQRPPDYDEVIEFFLAQIHKLWAIPNPNDFIVQVRDQLADFLCDPHTDNHGHDGDFMIGWILSISLTHGLPTMFDDIPLPSDALVGAVPKTHRARFLLIREALKWKRAAAPADKMPDWFTVPLKEATA